MKGIFRRRIDYAAQPDKALAQLAAEDKAAFAELYERYLPKIYNYVYYRVGNRHDAEDLTSKVFFRALSHIANYVDQGVPFQAWLYRIAHNLVANWHRDQGRRKIIALEDYVAGGLQTDAPDGMAEAKEAQRNMLEAVRRLPQDRQQLLLLKFIEGLSNAEIGEIMDRSEGAIKSLYHRTLLALRDDLGASDAAGNQEPRQKQQEG